MKLTTSLMFVLSVAVASPVLSQDGGKQEQRQRPAPFQQFVTLPGIEFSKEQQAKVDDLYESFLPKLTKTKRTGVVASQKCSNGH